MHARGANTEAIEAVLFDKDDGGRGLDRGVLSPRSGVDHVLQSGYPLRGAFWHASFGHVRSPDCVNVQPQDAKTLFHWTGPSLALLTVAGAAHAGPSARLVYLRDAGA